MNIYSKGKYPANKLSNFASHPFVLDGIQINSMERFLQSLKTSNPEMQAELCTLVGLAAKRRGHGKNWKNNQTLYWQGQAIKRESQDYTDLINRAYLEMAKQSISFQKTMKAAGNASFQHSLGSKKKSQTVLTRQEFIAALNMARDYINEHID